MTLYTGPSIEAMIDRNGSTRGWAGQLDILFFLAPKCLHGLFCIFAMDILL
jgi:hypothetical protein